MAGLPPLDWQHLPHYAAFLVPIAAFLALETWSERRDYRRKSMAVRSKLDSQACKRCGGPLGAWEGRFHHGDVHFQPGGYVPRVIVTCTTCRSDQVFYVSWEPRLSERGRIVDLDCHLGNRDVIFAGLYPDGDS